MYHRDPDLVNVIQADRVRALGVRPAPAAGPTTPRAGGLRRAIGRSLVRLGAWFAAERPDSLMEPA